MKQPGKPMTEILVRPEAPADAAAIAAAVRRSYHGVAYSNQREHLMIERLRRSPAYIPELALVAEVGGAIAGHIMLTRIRIRSEHGDVAALALAPLSVAPEFQRQGVGAALVRQAHRRGAELGYGAIVLVGIAGYYQQFGYQPLGNYPITLPFQVHPDHSLIIALAADGLDGVAGQVEYAPEWMESA